MQEKENLAFQEIFTVQKERFDLVKWIKHAAKRELHFLGDIDCIKRFDVVKWVNHAAKSELHFLWDIHCIERKVGPGKMG